MPLIVPALRLAMLFLNIYDSYKVLKPPAPSSRNANQPSLRAITQRKRNMKASLAVWIVWCCYITYERIVETFVSLFIPFYDELKSLVILFLILTRARGAEPVYLHIIRPFVKPYTETVDSILDLTFLAIDVAIAAMNLPVKSARALWNRWSGRGGGESESDATPTDHLNGYASATRLSHESLDAGSPVSRSASSMSNSPSTYPILQENGRPIFVPSRVASEHEIWHPPPSAYLEDEEGTGLILPEHQRTSTSSSLDSEATLVQDADMDEWRQYPRFPAAYPPTPLVSVTHLTAKPVSSKADMYTNGSTIPSSKQDFPQSLSPLSEVMDPESDGDLSDETRKERGIRSRKNDENAMSVDPDTRDSTVEEEEDEFNVTLQTPLHPQAFTQLFFQPARMPSRATALATSGTRSTDFSTAHNGFSLRSRSSLDSISSAANTSDEGSPTIGKKRPLPLSSNHSNRNTKVVIGPGLDSGMKHNGTGDEGKHKRHAPITLPSGLNKPRPDSNETLEPKRRKLASPRKMSARTSRPVRPRLTRAVSPPPRVQRKPFPEQARPLPQRRERAASTLHLSKPVAPYNDDGTGPAPVMSKSRVVGPRGHKGKLTGSS